MEIEKPKYYTEAHRKATQRYREKNRDDYNQSQRKLYEKSKENEEWRKQFNEKQKKYNAVYRQKLREEAIKNGDVVIRGRGRPRKVVLN